MNLIRKYFINLWHASASLNNNWLASQVETGNGLKVLDLGCEDGTLILERIKDKINNPQIYGIEIEPKLVQMAKKNGVKAIKASVEKPFPYKNNFFDFVSANQIIEHVLDVDIFVEEIYRVLKPGGYVLISTENLSSWHNIFALVLGWQAFSQHISRKLNVGNPLRINKVNLKNLLPTSGMHIKIFTPRGLRELFEINGFKIEKTFGAGHYPFPPSISHILSLTDPIHTAFIAIKARKPKEI